jgi:non-ribosomal peptide synthetase-like protein
MTSLACDMPATNTEATLAKVLADLVGVERVQVDSHFFDELGADSMLMARFCARARKQPNVPSVSMKDIYRHPTIRGLAQALDAALPSANPAPTSASVKTPAPTPTEVAAPPVSTPQYVLCGTLQLLSAFAYAFFLEFAFVRGYQWIVAAPGGFDAYVRSVLFGGALFAGMCVLPILAKWTLIGRWRPQQIRLWSLAYFRFWLVKTLIRFNPLVLFVGSPLYVLYLRALGAKIGRNVLILSTRVPVCTDLLTVGDGSVIHKDVHIHCYRARVGWIETGPVGIGRDAFVGANCVLDIETSIGDGAQLGHASSLHAGQAVPDGEHLQGSPARQRTAVDYRELPPKRVGMLRVLAYTSAQLLSVLLVAAPLAVGGVVVLAALVPQLGALVDAQSAAAAPIWMMAGEALAISFGLVFGPMLLSLLVVMTVPRVLNLVLEPDQAYALYGLRYWAHRAIARLTNSAYFHRLFGDSSYIVPYLRWLGYDLSDVEQTGSNFGTEMRHDTPYLVKVGSGTMVADGLSCINADYSSTSFRLSRVVIGARSFIGNQVIYPSQARTGDNCLYATKVMVPMDGPVREGVGLLGSPDFEIPRTVLRDHKFDHLAQGDEFRRRLAAKDGHNAVTIGLFLLSGWALTFELALLAWVAAGLFPAAPMFVVALFLVVSLVLIMAHVVLVDRLSTMFQPLQPRHCSIYDPYFWWHERYWKLSASQTMKIWDGTPFKPLIWRLLGARMGKRVFDDGALLLERTLISIGDDCVLNAGCVLQPHSQEDGNFKSDRISIGARCTIGVASLVHYGTTLGDGASLAPASFLMKGEEVPPNARWGGNPAMEIRNERAAVVTSSARRSR